MCVGPEILKSMGVSVFPSVEVKGGQASEMWLGGSVDFIGCLRFLGCGLKSNGK